MWLGQKLAAPIHRLLLNLGVEEANIMSGIALYYQNYMVKLLVRRDDRDS